MPEVLRVLPNVKPGTVTEVKAPDRDGPSGGRSRA
jgi:hypothetical protein